MRITAQFDDIIPQRSIILADSSHAGNRSKRNAFQTVVADSRSTNKAAGLYNARKRKRKREKSTQCNAAKNPNRQIRISIRDSAPFTQHRETFRSIRHGITSTGDRIYTACSTWNASTARLSNIQISHTTSRRNTHDIRNNNTGAIAVDSTRFKQATNSNGP